MYFDDIQRIYSQVQKTEGGERKEKNIKFSLLTHNRVHK